MKIARILLIIVATAISAMPLFWMVLITDAQISNLWLQPPYWREFAFASAFWVGFVSAGVFARRCFAHGLKAALTPFILTMIAVGIAGGIGEEITLLNNPKTPFPFGYFELAPLSWVIVGVAASMRLHRSGVKAAK